MKMLFTGGGTGGHVYPALAVIDRLLSDGAGVSTDIAWVGRAHSIEEDLVTRRQIPYWPISTGALRGRSPFQAVASIGRLLRGVGEARRLVREWQPDVVFSTGGYVTAPLTLAAWFERVPVVIYLPDMEPGLAIKLLARFATRVCVSFESVVHYFDRRKTVVTGYPVRQDLLHVDGQQARQRLGLSLDDRVLLVLGGSSGAHSINMAVRDHLEELLSSATVIHVSGPADLDVMQSAARGLPDNLREAYRLYGYLHSEMADALAAADLVVARAGASTLAEFPAASLPAILVPYPYAGPNQGVNAEFLAKAGGALVVPDAELSDRIVDTVRGLLSDEARLATMGRAMSAVLVPDAAERLCECLVQAARGRRRG